jgi:hypothetical protein
MDRLEGPMTWEELLEEGRREVWEELCRSILEDGFSGVGWCARGYWERLSEISASPDSRLCRTKHAGQHHTTYILELEGAFFPVVAKTIQMMEVTYSR